MGLINFILNLAGLLLWLGWRDAHVDTLVPASAASLIRTLRRVGPSEWVRWKNLFGLLGLLLCRAIIYAWIGTAVSWIPAVLLGPIPLLFRSQILGQILLYSFLSFGLTLGAFYVGLLLFSLVNARVSDAEPFQKFIRRHLGRAERLPWIVKLFLPPLVGAVCWLVLGPLLSHWEIVPGATFGMRFEQGLIIGAGACLIWKHIIGATLLLFFLNNHVYFGKLPLWGFVTVTARNLIAPVRWWPMRVGRTDFAPIVMLSVVYVLAYVVENGVHHHAPGVDKVWVPGLVDFYRWAS